jgi:glycosyltransferase involved in cell wall biosynthesis
MNISVIMPALNEEKNILAAIDSVLRAMDTHQIEGEIIVVNDGSTDGTEKLVSDVMIKDKRVKMIKHEKPHGIGASFWGGVCTAECNVVIMLPGDNENDPLEIFRYFRLLEHVDIVIPFVFNREVRSIFRNALSFVFRFIINTTFLVNFHYTNGTVLYRKAVLNKLKYKSKGFFFQTDILVRLIKKNYLFAEVPYKLGVRDDGKSKAMSFPSLINVARGYLRLVKDIYFNKDNSDLVLISRKSSTFLRRRRPKNDRTKER